MVAGGQTEWSDEDSVKVLVSAEIHEVNLDPVRFRELDYTCFAADRIRGPDAVYWPST